MGKNDDVWPEEVQIDRSTYEAVSESGEGQVILGTAGPVPPDEWLILREDQ